MFEKQFGLEIMIWESPSEKRKARYEDKLKIAPQFIPTACEKELYNFESFKM